MFVNEEKNIKNIFPRWNFFSPQKRKINLIGTLVHRAFTICLKSKLGPEPSKICSILLENGYLEHTIKSAFKQKLQQLHSNPVHTVEKCPVYLHIPWIGNVLMKFKKQITSAVKRCFFSVEPRVIFTTQTALTSNQERRVTFPSLQQCHFQFVCHCNSRYVGCTSQRLEQQIKQHVSRFLAQLPRTTVKAFPALARPTYAHNNFTNPPLVNIFLTTPMRSSLQQQQIFYSRSRSIFFSSFCF